MYLSTLRLCLALSFNSSGYPWFVVLDPLSEAGKGSMSARACVRASSFLTSVSGVGGGGIVGETGR